MLASSDSCRAALARGMSKIDEAAQKDTPQRAPAPLPIEVEHTAPAATPGSDEAILGVEPDLLPPSPIRVTVCETSFHRALDDLSGASLAADRAKWSHGLFKLQRRPPRPAAGGIASVGAAYSHQHALILDDVRCLLLGYNDATPTVRASYAVVKAKLVDAHGDGAVEAIDGHVRTMLENNTAIVSKRIMGAVAALVTSALQQDPPTTPTYIHVKRILLAQYDAETVDSLMLQVSDALEDASAEIAAQDSALQVRTPRDVVLGVRMPFHRYRPGTVSTPCAFSLHMHICSPPSSPECACNPYARRGG